MKITRMDPIGGAVSCQQQFIIEHYGKKYFKSYNTIIAEIDRAGRITLDPMHDCSMTTKMFRGQFLGLNAKEVKRKIASGEIKIRNLN